MLKTLTLCAAIIFAASTVSATPALDAQGKCREKGKFVAASMCKVPAAKSAGRCRDKTSKKFVKCGARHSEPVPIKKK
jgi:hypothetical protein